MDGSGAVQDPSAPSMALLCTALSPSKGDRHCSQDRLGSQHLGWARENSLLILRENGTKPQKQRHSLTILFRCRISTRSFIALKTTQTHPISAVQSCLQHRPPTAPSVTAQTASPAQPVAVPGHCCCPGTAHTPGTRRDNHCTTESLGRGMGKVQQGSGDGEI